MVLIQAMHWSNTLAEMLCNLQRVQQGCHGCEDRKRATTDVRIVCSDGYIPVHRFLLQNISSFFHEIFNAHDNQPKKIRDKLLAIHLPDFKIISMQKFLQVLYCGMVCTLSAEELTEVREIMETVGLSNMSISVEKTQPEDLGIFQKPLVYMRRLKEINYDSKNEIYGVTMDGIVVYCFDPASLQSSDDSDGTDDDEGGNVGGNQNPCRRTDKKTSIQTLAKSFTEVNLSREVKTTFSADQTTPVEKIQVDKSSGYEDDESPPVLSPQQPTPFSHPRKYCVLQLDQTQGKREVTTKLTADKKKGKVDEAVANACIKVVNGKVADTNTKIGDHGNGLGAKRRLRLRRPRPRPSTVRTQSGCQVEKGAAGYPSTSAEANGAAVQKAQATIKEMPAEATAALTDQPPAGSPTGSQDTNQDSHPANDQPEVDKKIGATTFEQEIGGTTNEAVEQNPNDKMETSSDQQEATRSRSLACTKN